MRGKDETISTLNRLIRTDSDSVEGFRTAAEGVKDPELQSLFNEYAQQRAQFRGELQEQVRRLGGEPEESGGVMGAVHRGWINIRKTVQGGDRKAILSESERGEDHAKDAYTEALEKELPPEVRSTVEKQYNSVLEGHDRIKMLRDQDKGRAA